MMRKVAGLLAVVALLPLLAGPLAWALRYPPGPGGAWPDTLSISHVQNPSAVPHPVAPDSVYGVGGIVTGFDPIPSGFAVYLQTSCSGSSPNAYTGVDVFTGSFNFGGAPFNLALGDSVIVYGRVAEFPPSNGGTEIEGLDGVQGTQDLAWRKISSGNPLPPFHAGTVNNLREPAANTNGELWEGMLVRIAAPMRVARVAGLGANAFLVVDATVPPASAVDSVFVDGATLTTYAPPALGVVVDRVQGIYEQRSRGYRIQLRDGNDILLSTPPNLVDAYPVAENQVRVVFDRNVTSASATNVGNYSLASFGSVDVAVMDGADKAVLTITSGSAHGALETVTATNIVGLASGLPQTTPQQRTFVNGVLTTGEISAPNPDSLSGSPCRDKSAYAGPGGLFSAGQLGPRVSVTGVVTAAFGNVYAMEDPVPTEPANNHRGLTVFAPPVLLTPGHKYLLAGNDQEFFGENELAGITHVIDLGPQAIPAPIPLTLAIAGLDTCDVAQNITSARDYLSELVSLPNARVVQRTPTLPADGFYVAGPAPTFEDTLFVQNLSNALGPNSSGNPAYPPLDAFVSVVGVVHYANGTFRVCPRSPSDYLQPTNTISAPLVEGGTIAPSGAVAVPLHGNQAFTITANPSYSLTDVVVDGTSVGPVGSYTFTNVVTPHSIDIRFSPLGAPPCNTGLIVNGTFNTQVPNTGTGGGWTTSSMLPAGSAWVSWGGNPGAYLWLNNIGASGSDPTAEQSPALTYGAPYVLKGDYATIVNYNLPGGTSNKSSFAVDIGPVSNSFTAIPTGPGSNGYRWTPFSVSFQAPIPPPVQSPHQLMPTPIKFRGETNSTDNDFGIDNICLLPLSCLTPPAGMTDWWPLDETLPGPAKTKDIIGIADGTIKNSPSSVVGVAGNAFSFPGGLSGTPAYVDCGNPVGDFQVTSATRGAFSIDAWVRLNTGHNTCAVVVDNHTGAANFTGYELLIDNSNHVQFVIGTGAAPSVILGPVIPADGVTWTAIAVTAQLKDAFKVPFGGPWLAKYFCTLYVNGVAVGTTTTVLCKSMGSGSPFTIGGNTSTCKFGGAIDEVELFDRALRPIEVAGLAVVPKCRCRVEACKLQEVGTSDSERYTTFRLCNDGPIGMNIPWSISPEACAKSSAITGYVPQSGAEFVPAHSCVNVSVRLTITPFQLFSANDVACYRVATGLCGPGGTSIGSITGPVANCPVNEDTCFASHRGEGPVQIRWQFANRSGTPQDLEWFVREQGATADSAYPVVSLNGQQPGVPTPTSLVHVPGNGSATVSVAAWMLGAQALSPTHLQLFARASGDTSAHVLVADRGMYSDETSGVRFAGWGSFVPEGTGPSARMGGTMIFDRQNHRFVLFGGATASDSVNEVWACDAGPSSTWNLLTPAGSGPGPRVGAAAIYDPVRHRMLVVGGDATNDAVYALSLTPGSEAWSVLAPAGSGLGARKWHSAIYDPFGDRLVVYGGVTAGNVGLATARALALSGAPVWSVLPSNPYTSQYGHTAVYDPVGNRMLTFGGIRTPNQNGPTLFVMSLTGSPTWGVLSPAGGGPQWWAGSVAMVDSATSSMIVLGGYSDRGQGQNAELWSLSLGGANRWTSRTPFDSSATSALRYAMGPAQSVDGYFHLFGGRDNVGALTSELQILPVNPSNVPVIPVAVPSATIPKLLTFSIGPNPFRSSTAFSIALPTRTSVSLGIYDIAGRRLQKIDAGPLGPGDVSLFWDGRDAGGRLLAPGVYLVRMQAGDNVLTRRVIRVN